MKITVTKKNGEVLVLQKFGKDLVNLTPEYGFNKESKWYLELKKNLCSILFRAQNLKIENLQK